MSIIVKKVVTDTFTMNYFKFGKGEKTFVILPGLSVQSVIGTAEAVANGYHLLTDDFTVYVFDRRENLPPDYKVADMAKDTAEAFKALGLSSIYLFGASQGGMIAIEIAIEHPELISKLILGSTSAHVDNDRFAAIEKWISIADKKDRVGLYLDMGKKIYPADFFERYKDAFISAGNTVTDNDLERFIILAKGTKDFNVTDRLCKIKCPVFAVGEAFDAVLGPNTTEEIAEKLKDRPDFEMFIYNGYGHANFDTAPDYKERILDFCRK